MYKNLYNAISDFLFPPKCILCSDFIHTPRPLFLGLSPSDNLESRENIKLIPSESHSQNKKFYSSSRRKKSLTTEILEVFRGLEIFSNAEIRQNRKLYEEFNDSKDLPALFRKLITPYVCRNCISEIKPLLHPICPVCGIMFRGGTGEDHLCGKCIKKPKNFIRARAGGIYIGILRSLIHSLKYKDKVSAAKPLSLFLFYCYLTFFYKKSFDYILPIPLHIKKMRKRGYNQSYLLVKYWRGIAKNFKINLPAISINDKIIKKRKNTIPQAGLSAIERAKNIKDSFIIEAPEAVYGKNFLIIDDVFTTGATVDECAETLKKAGAKRIEVLTLARGLHRV